MRHRRGASARFENGPPGNLDRRRSHRSNARHRVLALDSYDHWEDKAKGLADVARILAEDGRFVVAKDASVPGFSDDWADFLDAIELEGFSTVRQQEISGDGCHFQVWIGTWDR